MNKTNSLIDTKCELQHIEELNLKILINCKKNSVIEFGSYPQTIKEENITIINTKQDEKGYFTGSDGEKYAFVKAKPFDNYEFSNNKEIVIDVGYYFKVEPIKWKVLDNINGKVFLFSEAILDAHKFDDKLNSYELSNIRKYLNNEFYNKAFTEKQKELLESTILNDLLNKKDKVFLLSKEEMTSSLLGFKNNDEEDYVRSKRITDYAKANGSYEYIGSNNGFYWLCTAYNDKKMMLSNAYFVGYDGYIDYDCVYDSHYGVAPALVIDKKSFNK